MTKKTVNVNLNRVEGDLEISLDTENGVITSARTVGTLYRGFEQIMLQRSPKDALVITPRVCGICGTAHLYSAVLALENLWNLTVPPNAIRIRNLCLLAEGIQNDLRQTFLFFAPDFCHERYRNRPWFDELIQQFEPFKGKTYVQTLANTREATKIIAHFGGQWPHSSYMIPGGVTLPPSIPIITACRSILDTLQHWYETDVIGASLEDWLALNDADAYLNWLDDQSHRHSALGLLSRCVREMNLHNKAAGTPYMISVGSLRDPSGGSDHLLASGFYDGIQDRIQPFDHQLINEHVRHSWFFPYEGGKHPWQGETVPDFQPHSDRYTWAKAPRYRQHVVQTGPLAELLIGGDPLIRSLFQAEGSSAWLRQFARVRKVAHELHFAKQMLEQLATDLTSPHILNPQPEQECDGEGYGLVMAARGALGHWVSVKDGLIDRYQIITPTSWNASPRDSEGIPGHWEQSLVGLKIADLDDPIEVGHVIRSHDPCLVCTVHLLDTGQSYSFRP